MIKKNQKFFLRGVKKYKIFSKINFIVINKIILKNLYIYEVGTASAFTRWVNLYDQS